MDMEHLEHEVGITCQINCTLSINLIALNSSVSGPVRVGDPLTLIIYMRSKYGEILRIAFN